jgi:hypothetical protein
MHDCFYRSTGGDGGELSGGWETPDTYMWYSPYEQDPQYDEGTWLCGDGFMYHRDMFCEYS